jgi:pyruvate/2-oxoglutarate dehydrogenase complex dihydrolipoamide dehydrogenase (E3) component
MDYDVVVIGTGAAGEAAAYAAAARKARVAVVENSLVGGLCSFWACLPTKVLLDSARRRWEGVQYPFERATARRDWMINREGIDVPDDSGHEQDYRKQGAVPIRGRARLAGAGRVEVTLRDGGTRALQAGAVIVAVGSGSRMPRLDGLDAIRPWTNVEGTSTRTLPRSLLIMGGGPTGVELSQVYARYGVPVTLVHPEGRLVHRDHPRNSAALREALERDGVVVRTGVRAVRARAGAGPEGAHVVELSDGSEVTAHEVLVAIGRVVPFEGLGLETLGVDLTAGPPKPDRYLRIAPDVYTAGDAAGVELHTHLAHYQGDMAARIALGEDVTPDHRAIPRAVYTDPETGSVGLLVEEAIAAGHDAIERTADLATTAKGYVSQSTGHVTIVVDRTQRVLLGAFMSGPGASEAIHEAVLAVKVQVPLAVLADTLHAFPTLARVLGTLFISTAAELATNA